MFSFVKSPIAGMQIMLFFIGALLWLPALVHQQIPEPLVHTGEGFIYLTWRRMLEWPVIWQIVINIPVVALFIILLNHINLKHQVSDGHSQVVAWLALFMLASPDIFFRFHPAFLASLFVEGSYHIGLSLYRSRTPAFQIFNLSFLFSLSVLFYPPLVWMLPVMVLLVGLMTTPVPYQWSVMGVGLLSPFILTLVAARIIGETSYLFQDFFRWFEFRKSWPPGFLFSPPLLWVWLSFLFIWILLASARFRSQKNLSRQFYLILFFHFIITILTMLGMETVGNEMVWMLLIPLVFLFANWIRLARSGWFRDLFFLLLLGWWFWFHFRIFIQGF